LFSLEPSEADFGIVAFGRHPQRNNIGRVAIVFDDQNAQSLHCLPNEKATAVLPWLS